MRYVDDWEPARGVNDLLKDPQPREAVWASSSVRVVRGDLAGLIGPETGDCCVKQDVLLDYLTKSPIGKTPSESSANVATAISGRPAKGPPSQTQAKFREPGVPSSPSSNESILPAAGTDFAKQSPDFPPVVIESDGVNSVLRVLVRPGQWSKPLKVTPAQARVLEVLLVKWRQHRSGRLSASILDKKAGARDSRRHLARMEMDHPVLKSVIVRPGGPGQKGGYGLKYAF